MGWEDGSVRNVKKKQDRNSKLNSLRSLSQDVKQKRTQLLTDKKKFCFETRPFFAASS